MIYHFYTFVYFRFLLVCANCKWSNIVNNSLDIFRFILFAFTYNIMIILFFSNISTDIDLSSDGTANSNFLILKTVSECIFSDDKLRIIRGLEILAGLCNMDQNESIICEFLNDKILARVFDVVSVKDIMLCIYTLESLYQVRIYIQRIIPLKKF